MGGDGLRPQLGCFAYCSSECWNAQISEGRATGNYWLGKPASSGEPFLLQKVLRSCGRKQCSFRGAALDPYGVLMKLCRAPGVCSLTWGLLSAVSFDRCGAPFVYLWSLLPWFLSPVLRILSVGGFFAGESPILSAHNLVVSL